MALTAITPDQQDGLDEIAERFCREYVATGGNATQAYLRVRRATGGEVTYGSANELARRLLQKVVVQERIAAIRADLAGRARLSLAERYAVLESIAYADPLDVWEPGPGGKMFLRPLDEIPPEARLAIQEIVVEQTKDGPRRRAKMHSRTEAIEILNKMDGVYKQTVQHEGQVEHWVMALPATQPSVEEWRMRFAPQLPAGSTETG